MEDILKVHVVKQELDYANVVKQNAIGAAVVLTIGTILPAVVTFTARKAKEKFDARRQAKKDTETN